VTAPRGAAPGDADELIRISDGVWKAFDDRDWDALYALTTPGFVVRTDERWPGGGEFHGREAQQRFFDQFLEPWETLSYERTAEPEVIGSRVVERGAWIGTGRSTGIEGRIDFTAVATLTDGLVARTDFFIDHDAAMAFARGD
jgi:hypothetical protein